MRAGLLGGSAAAKDHQSLTRVLFSGGNREIRRLNRV